MSTLPFLLSVADELDNINSQSYLDDFGLGFHPHRQYYRTPTIQLSLPAGTEWMEERQRYRPHKFYDDTLNNLPSTSEEDATATAAATATAGYKADDSGDDDGAGEDGDGNALDNRRGRAHGASTSAAAAAGGRKAGGGGGGAAAANDEDNIDSSVQLYNLSKKCCKNYYRHNAADHHPHCPKYGSGGGGGKDGKEKASGGGGGGYRLHPKCMEGNHSSSEESLQKVSSSIEFLTCFLLKKTRPSSKHAGSGGGGRGAGDDGDSRSSRKS